jgi:hypothetical protein
LLVLRDVSNSSPRLGARTRTNPPPHRGVEARGAGFEGGEEDPETHVPLLITHDDDDERHDEINNVRILIRLGRNFRLLLRLLKSSSTPSKMRTLALLALVGAAFGLEATLRMPTVNKWCVDQ